MTEREAPTQFRRLSFYRQLSDVWKSKRKSYSYVSPPLPPSISNATFVWNCALTEVKNTLIKQKSISYDDVAFLSTNEDQTMLEISSKDSHGLFENLFKNFFFFMINLDSINQVLVKSLAGKERSEKRNSTGSAILATVSI